MNLRDWLVARTPSEFPGVGSTEYVKQYKHIEDYFNKHVHPEVEKLAMTIDGGYLTDHGPKHVQAVIGRASDMIGDPAGRISPYETYLLLLAIHLHDVGNIYGRDGHEKQLGQIMAKFLGLLGGDAVEQRTIRNIAEAHAGKQPDGTPADTISRLDPAEQYRGEEVRMQALAGILRFADELADDADRASRLGLCLDVLPQDARIHHEYASRLHSVKLKPEVRTVELRFSLDSEVACRKFPRNGARKYLLDEIYDRTLKMHVERIYCSRFMRDLVSLEEIDVQVEVFQTHTHIAPIEKFQYELRESGYPETPRNIRTLVPDLKWDGITLKRHLRAPNNVDGDERRQT